MTWPMVRLGDVCEVRAGRDYKDVEASDGAYPIYGTGGVMGRSVEARCPENSVIVGRKGTLNNPMLVREPFWNIDTCFGVIPDNHMLPEYLWRFCQNFDFYQLVPASGRPSTTSDAIKAINIPLPPLAEQKKIVARLEKDLARVEKAQAEFARVKSAAEAYFKAALAEAFDGIKGEKVRLGEIFRFIDYRGKTPVKTKSGIPLITAKNIRTGYLDYAEKYYISEEEYKTRQSRGIAHKGDILFTTEAPLGYVAIADQEVFSTGQRIITFQWPNESQEHDNRYFLYYFMSPVFQRQLQSRASGATAQGIKASRLVDLSVVSTDVARQRSIVVRLDAAKERSEALVAVAERGLAICAKMRKAILSEAFANE